MANETIRIAIESVFGGQSKLSHFAAEDEFGLSLGIDPSMPLTDSGLDSASRQASGFLRPVGVSAATTTTQASPLWLVNNPRATTSAVSMFALDAQGSLYGVNAANGAVVELADGGTLSNGSGNGLEYYDNFIYIAKNTDVARYGPLDGSVTPEFNGSYWQATLGKSPLINKTYPANFYSGELYPNHILHRHSDGRLYIADVVDNKGTLHYIQTSKTTYEGDTDAGSTESKVSVGPGLWPTAVESYGEDLAIALFETNTLVNKILPRAKIAFWDTNSQNVNKITWPEFSDPLITALKNLNGILHVVSGNSLAFGFRISRFIGGYTFEELQYFEIGVVPLAGAVAGKANQLIFGSFTYLPEEAACVYSIGLQKSGLSNGLFNIARADSSEVDITVTAVAYAEKNFGTSNLIFGTSHKARGGVIHRALSSKDLSTRAIPIWRSQIYRIGRPFKITKVQFYVSNPHAIGSDAKISPFIYIDDKTTSPTALEPLIFTNTKKQSGIVRRPNNLTGQHNFMLEFNWQDAQVLSIGLPIFIDYELLPQDPHGDL